MMITGKPSAQALVTRARRRSAHDAFSATGKALDLATPRQTNTRATAIRMPGTMPARNSLLMEVLVVTP